MARTRRESKSPAPLKKVARGSSRSPTPKKLTASEAAMAKAKARRASKSPAPKRATTAPKSAARKAAGSRSPAPAKRTTRARSKSPARKPAAAPKSAAKKKAATTSPATTRGRSKSPARKTAARPASKKVTAASASPSPKRKAKKAAPTASEAAMAKAKARRASKSPAPKKRAAAKKEPRSPRSAARALRKAAAEAAAESFFEGEADEGGGGGGSAETAAAEEAEAAAFQKFLYVVLAAIVLTLACSPAGPDACDGVGLASLVQGTVQDGPGKTIVKTWKCARAYNQENPSFTLALICAIYVALQTCAIPGPIVLAVVAGGLYGFWGAQLLNAVCAGTGASFCALLSKKWGRGRLKALGMSAKVAQFRDAVQAHKDSLFTYMLMTRVTPVPNVVVNMASPHLGVPLWMLAITTPIGQFLFNCVYSKLGETLSAATELRDDEFAAKFVEQKAVVGKMIGCGTFVCALFVLKARADAAKKKAE